MTMVYDRWVEEGSKKSPDEIDWKAWIIAGIVILLFLLALGG